MKITVTKQYKSYKISINEFFSVARNAYEALSSNQEILMNTCNKQELWLAWECGWSKEKNLRGQFFIISITIEKELKYDSTFSSY